MKTTRDKISESLITAVGGMEAFVRTFGQRTFSPERSAQLAIADGVRDAESGLAALSAAGATPEQSNEWLVGYLKRWTAYQIAGARTANWMITGPARFPVERNNKRMAVEHKRSDELTEYVNGAAYWINRRNLSAKRHDAIAADRSSGVVHKEKVIDGVRIVLNEALDRVQILFPQKPTAKERTILKHEAFRWAPTVGAWQRQLTQNGIHAAERAVKNIIMDGDK